MSNAKQDHLGKCCWLNDEEKAISRDLSVVYTLDSINLAKSKPQWIFTSKGKCDQPVIYFNFVLYYRTISKLSIIIKNAHTQAVTT